MQADSRTTLLQLLKRRAIYQDDAGAWLPTGEASYEAPCDHCRAVTRFVPVIGLHGEPVSANGLHRIFGQPDDCRCNGQLPHHHPCGDRCERCGRLRPIAWA